MTEKPITDAQLWALRYIVDRKDPSPAMLGQHMSERPGMRYAGGGILRTSQGFGRLGAKMMKLLEKNGYATILSVNGGYSDTARPTPKGHKTIAEADAAADPMRGLKAAAGVPEGKAFIEVYRLVGVSRRKGAA